MSMTPLNRPAQGSTNWFTPIDTNWQIIETTINQILSSATPCSFLTATNSTTVTTAPSGSFHDITFDTNSTLIGSDISHSLVTNTQKFTINTSGTYAVTFSITGTSGQKFKTRLLLNGTTQIPGAIVDNYTDLNSTNYTGSSWLYQGPSVFSAQCTVYYNFTAGDYFTLQVYDPSGQSFSGDNSTISIMGPVSGGGFDPVKDPYILAMNG